MSQSQSDSTAGLGLPQVAACLLVGYFVFRWFFKSNDPSGTAQRRPPPVDPRHLQQQTEVIRSMFPQVSVAAVQAELIRNGGNIEITTEKILTNGFLPEPPAPPASTPAPPATPGSRPTAPTARRQAAPAASSASSSSTIFSQYTDLITRYNLHSRLQEPELPSALVGKGKAPATKYDRQLAHHNKRDDMILAARRRMEHMDKMSRAEGQL